MLALCVLLGCLRWLCILRFLLLFLQVLLDHLIVHIYRHVREFRRRWTEQP